MKRHSNEQWRELFAQHDTSGVSAAEFCKQNNLCPKYFSLRRKQLIKKNSEIETGFVRAQVKQETKRKTSGSMTTSLTIHCNAGQLVFGALPQPGWLAQLLRDLA
jgi:hypothetical protein